MDPDIEFEALPPGVKANYSCSDHQELMTKVLYRGDWCLSIVKDTDEHHKDLPWRAYSHWAELCMHYPGPFATEDAAREHAVAVVKQIRRFLHAKFFLRKKQ